MRRLSVFNSVSLDGFFTDANSDMTWAHKDDAEWNAFVAGNASGNGVLVFGRITYEMMVAFWPTPAAMETMPEVARGMNDAEKIVFSRTLGKATWKNTKVVKGDPAAEIRKLKKETGPDLVILGSGSIVSQLTEAGLVDEYQLAVCPIVLGKGRTLFEGVTRKLDLKLSTTRAFANGTVFLRYQRAA